MSYYGPDNQTRIDAPAIFSRFSGEAGLYIGQQDEDGFRQVNAEIPGRQAKDALFGSISVVWKSRDFIDLGRSSDIVRWDKVVANSIGAHVEISPMVLINTIMTLNDSLKSLNGHNSPLVPLDVLAIASQLPRIVSSYTGARLTQTHLFTNKPNFLLDAKNVKTNMAPFSPLENNTWVATDDLHLTIADDLGMEANHKIGPQVLIVTNGVDNSLDLNQELNRLLMEGRMRQTDIRQLLNTSWNLALQ